MNANSNFSDFALDVILKRISQVKIGKDEKDVISISSVFNVDAVDADELKLHKDVFAFLMQEKIIDCLKDKTENKCIQDDDGFDHEMYFFTSSFILKHKELKKFLIATSRIPKYSLRIDEKRRLILNDKYILNKLQFDSTNYIFIQYCLEHPNTIVTKDDLAKIAGKNKEFQRFHCILSNIKISPNLNGVFFPNVGMDATRFRNNVTVADIAGSKINEKKINNFIKNLPKL